MKLTAGQTKPLWRLLGTAWAAHCKRTGDRVSDAKAKTAWRAEVLKRETGFDSLTDVPRAGRFYVDFMAELEVIADDGSCYWLLQKHGADVRPYHHAINELIERHDLQNAYVEEIVRRVLRLPEFAPMPGWGAMKVSQLGPILGALKRTCRHRLTQEAAA